MTGFISILLVLQSIMIVFIVKRLMRMQMVLHLLAQVTEELVAESEGAELQCPNPQESV